MRTFPSHPSLHWLLLFLLTSSSFASDHLSELGELAQEIEAQSSWAEAASLCSTRVLEAESAISSLHALLSWQEMNPERARSFVDALARDGSELPWLSCLRYAVHTPAEEWGQASASLTPVCRRALVYFSWAERLPQLDPLQSLSPELRSRLRADLPRLQELTDAEEAPSIPLGHVLFEATLAADRGEAALALLQRAQAAREPWADGLAHARALLAAGQRKAARNRLEAMDDSLLTRLPLGAPGSAKPLEIAWARLLLESGQAARASKELRSLLKHDERDSWLLYHFALAQLHAGNKDKAVQNLERAAQAGFANLNLAAREFPRQRLQHARLGPIMLNIGGNQPRLKEEAQRRLVAEQNLVPLKQGWVLEDQEGQLLLEAGKAGERGLVLVSLSPGSWKQNQRILDVLRQLPVLNVDVAVVDLYSSLESSLIRRIQSGTEPFTLVRPSKAVAEALSLVPSPSVSVILPSGELALQKRWDPVVAQGLEPYLASFRLP